MDLKTEIYSISKGIGFFIKRWIKKNHKFDSRTFYGESFSLAFLNELDMLESNIKKDLIFSYENIDKSDPEFHWEFNNYALFEYFNNSGDSKVVKFLYPLKFKNTECTNWTLLRSNVRLLAEQDIKLALKEAKYKLNKFQLDSGLILDEKNVKSFQYHCFSTAMIAELYIKTKEKKFLNSFLLGVKFIRKFILRNGEALYIGRGQKQSFGYGAIVYILSLAYKYSNDKTILGDLNKIIDFLKPNQKENGSYPLVINEIKQGIPKIVDVNNPNYSGWYPYNNYFDYLPFMGFFLIKSYKILKDLDVNNIKYRKKRSYIDKNFVKVVKKRYEAVISKPGGYWTNDMPIPYLVSNGKTCTPCYGGEQFQKSLYSLKGIPLPFCKLFNKSIRWRSYSYLSENILWLVSPLGIMRREFIFKDKSIKIKTKVYSLFKFVNLYLFLNETKYDNNKLKINNMEIKSKNQLTFEGYEYSTDGKLKLFVDENKNSIIEFIFNE